MEKLILPVIFILTCYSLIFAGEPQLLTLEEAIQIALNKSYAIKNSKLQLYAAKQSQRAAKGRFRTNVGVDFDLPYWSEMVSEIPVKDALPVFNTTGILRYEGQLQVRQPLPTDGLLWLNSRVYHRDVSIYQARLAGHEKRKEVYSSVSLHFQQPLFTINRLKTGLLQANLYYERNERRYKQDELGLVYDVTAAFFNLYRALRQVEIAGDDAKQQEELYELAAKKYEAGLVPEVESLQMEVDLAEARNNLVAAKSEQVRAQDIFVQLLGLDFDENVSVNTEMQISHFDVDLKQAIGLALQNRAEIRENEINVELARLAVREADARSEISGNLWAFYDITGVSDSNLPYRSGPQELWHSSLEDMDRRPNNRGVGFTLSVPLFDWGVNAAEIESATAEMRQGELALIEQKKTIIREVRNAVASLREAENRLDVLEKRQQVAERAFEITVQRFNNGDITSQELALDRDRLVTAKTAYLDAYIYYKLAIADLERKTLWDFTKDRSLVE